MTVYLLGGKRTPQGSFLGSLSSLSAPFLGGVAIKAALEKTKIAPERVDEVFMGNVLSAGLGQAPARQAALSAGLPDSVPCTTVNKVCGSGLKTLIIGAQSLKAGDNELVVAGGMENMSSAPHLLLHSRQGSKFGDVPMKDSMQWDGLHDVYSNRPMGECAEECSSKYSISREEQDQYAMESFRRSQMAIEKGFFDEEIAEVVIKSKKGDLVVKQDEGPFKANFEKIPKLRPVFLPDGTITAANASSINDAAAAIVMGGEKYSSNAEFKLVSYASHAHSPTWFTTSPVESMKICLEKAKLKIDDIGLFEINEAFALVPIYALKEMNLNHNRVNIYGGGLGLGHPIGCSGTRIVVTLMNAMKRENVEFGMASACIGGGESLSLIIQRI